MSVIQEISQDITDILTNYQSYTYMYGIGLHVYSLILTLGAD